MTRFFAAVHWLDVRATRFRWVAWALLSLSALTVVYFAADRDPPFEILHAQPASARPGEYVTLRAWVRRDTHRQCSAEYSRFIFASDGTRYELDTQQVGADFIEQLQRRTPNELIITFRLPPLIATGPASLTTSMRYRCNKTQTLWPIEVSTAMPFVVLPP